MLPPQAADDFIGRTSELDEISAFLDDVRGGPAALVVEGPAGIGKTSLWDAGLTLARSQEYRVLVSRPTEPEASLSFAGLGDLFEDALDEVSAELPDPQREALEVVLMRREAEDLPPSELAVSLGVRGVIAALAVNTPVIVSVDDLQWLDPSSARFLDFALRRLPSARVGLLGSVRSDERPGLIPSLEQAFPDGRVSRVVVGGFAPAEFIQLIRSRLGTDFTRSTLVRIRDSCGGNPLHGLELARALLRSGRSPDPSLPLPVPEGLRQLIMDRLSDLAPDVRELLLVASITSDPSTGLLARLGWSMPQLDSLLAIGVERGVLEVFDGRIRFVHPLLATVLCSDQPVEEIRGLHRRLADAVTNGEDRARHLALGAEGPDEGVAATLEDAAILVRRRGAPAAAAELVEHAARLTPSNRPEKTRRRVIAAAEYHLDAGDAARSRELLEHLVPDLPHGAVRAVALQRLGWARYHDDSWTSAARLFEEARKEASGEPGLEASITLDESLASLLAGDVGASADQAKRALEQAVRHGEPGLIAEATSVAGSIDFLLGRGVPGDLMERAVEMETWRRPRPTMKQPSVALGILLKWSDDYERAHSLLDRARRRIVEDGNYRSLPFVLFHLSELESWTGDWELAHAHAEEGHQIAVDLGQVAGQSFCLYAKALVHALRGLVQAARNEAEEGLTLSERSGAVPAQSLLRGVLGFIDLSLGDVERASAPLGLLAEGVTATGIFEPGVLRFLGDAIETMIARGELETAERLTRALAARSKELGRPWGSAVAARCDGLVAATRGDPTRAVRSLEAALGHLEKVTLPFEHARTLLALGGVLRRDRKRRAARETLERSLAGFESLGAPLWADRARWEASRIGGRAPTSLALTPTEDRIAMLVAGGAKNQEVANELFLTIKTVEWHLSQIYRKLGVRSRTELARWMSSREPPASSP